MNERIVTPFVYIAGTTTANVVFIQEFPYPATLLGVKACASNASAAKLGVAGAGGTTITSAAIGQSADPTYLEPTAATVGQVEAASAAFTFTLDYDGASGTAGQNISIMPFYLVGEA